MLVGKGMLISFLPKAVCHKLWRDMATATDALWSLSKISSWCELFPCLKGSCQKWKTPFKTTPSWAGWHAMHEKEWRRWTFAFIGKQQTGANCGGRSWKQSSDDEPLLVSQFSAGWEILTEKSPGKRLWAGFRITAGIRGLFSEIFYTEWCDGVPTLCTGSLRLCCYCSVLLSISILLLFSLLLVTLLATLVKQELRALWPLLPMPFTEEKAATI